jgi:hypothetical protein
MSEIEQQATSSVLGRLLGNSAVNLEEINKIKKNEPNLEVDLKNDQTFAVNKYPGQIDTRVIETPVSQTLVSNRPESPIDQGIYKTITSEELDKIGYMKLANTIIDALPSQLDPYEIVTYLRLYRLSYGFHNTTCLVGYTGLSKATFISEKQTRRAISKLISIGLIKVIEVVNTKNIKGSRYEVRVPIPWSNRHPRQIDTPISQTTNKNIIDDHDDLKKQDHHQSEHEKNAMMIYQNVTGNVWTKADLATYQKIKNIPLEAIEIAIKLATQRASSRPNSLAFFVKEIIATANPKTNRSKQKKYMEKIVDRLRNSLVGSTYSMSDFVYKVKESCLREDIAFDNDLLDELLAKKNS